MALIVVALFPYISATDDILRIQSGHSQHDKEHPAKKTANDELVRLYEAMDAPLVCEVQHVSMVFVFVCFVVITFISLVGHLAPFESGRSPPAAA
jgi:hypothetical protein